MWLGCSKLSQCWLTALELHLMYAVVAREGKNYCFEMHVPLGQEACLSVLLESREGKENTKQHVGL